MVYSLWLLGLSALFVLLERIWPRRKQRLLRRGWLSDVVYLVFNSEYLGVLLGAVIALWAARLDRVFFVGLMAGFPFAVQLPVLILSFDFLQWAVHNLLHRVPWLWRIHQVHHSIEEMDWIGNWRFHGLEVVVYRVLMYPAAALCGFGVEALFAYGVFNTLMGHFAHANLRVNLGWLRYVFNSPEMHLWHHNHPDSGPVNRNFGIALSVWDWLFGTAYLPGQDPQRLGFARIESYPQDVLRQLLAPFRRNAG